MANLFKPFQLSLSQIFPQGSCGGPCGPLPPNPSKSCIVEAPPNPASVHAEVVEPISDGGGDNNINCNAQPQLI